MYDLINKLEIAKRINEIRSSKNITQEKMAELIGVSYVTYVKIEHGGQNLTIKHLVNISKILNVSADMLLFGVSPDEKYGFEDYIKISKFFAKNNVKDMRDVFDNILKMMKE